MTHPVPSPSTICPTECGHCSYRRVANIHDRYAFCCTALETPVRLRWRKNISGDRTAACLKAYPVEVQS